MAATQVSVRVFDGPTVIDESIRRPVRLTPDGYAGVAYGGAVYPLKRGDVIDISESSWEFEDCNRFLLTGVHVPYPPSGGDDHTLTGTAGFDVPWHVETNRFGHYVVFNSSERLAVDVVEALEAAGLSVQRWDVSHRMADDGRFYDWFARLRFKGSREECLARVSAVMTPVEVGLLTVQIERDPSEVRIEELESQVEALLDQLVELREAMEASDDEAADLRGNLHRARERESQLQTDLDRALDHQSSMREQIALLTAAVQDSLDTQALLHKHNETEEMLELALAENAGLRADIDTLKVQSDADAQRTRSLQAALEDLTARLSELRSQERERRRASAPTRGPRIGAEGFIHLSFARITFVFDSVEVLANFETPASAMRLLTQIDMGQVVGKDLEGIRGWREVSKVSTGIAGSEDLGRIYYKPHGDRVLVSVHLKQDDKEQRRHVEHLRSL